MGSAVGERAWQPEVLRLNALCPYYTMFPVDFPLSVLPAARSDGWVLDPFCGRGTTLFAARLRGRPCAGIDVNPVAAALAKAKLVDIHAETVIGLCRRLLHCDAPRVEVPRDPFWGWCFHPDTLVEICVIRLALLNAPDTAASIALRALMLGILHGPLRPSRMYLSNQMPRTYATKPAAAIRYWERHELRPPRIGVLETVRRRARYSLAQLPRKVPGWVVQGDATEVLERCDQKFATVITSPPYFGMQTYLPDQWLRAWFLGGPPTPVYSAADQLPQGSQSQFVEALARVWRSTAAHCSPGATLVVRFGTLPSRSIDAEGLFRRSLSTADAGWQITSMRPAGSPPKGRRQADQFTVSTALTSEFDCTAVLSS